MPLSEERREECTLRATGPELPLQYFPKKQWGVVVTPRGVGGFASEPPAESGPAGLEGSRPGAERAVLWPRGPPAAAGRGPDPLGALPPRRLWEPRRAQRSFVTGPADR